MKLPHLHPITPVLAILIATSSNLPAQEAIALVERFSAGTEYGVNARVKLKGELAVPVDKDKPPQLTKLEGRSSINYDERILTAEPKIADQRTIRKYDTIDFRRSAGDRIQEISLRADVRRLVVMKRKNAKVPFSPDGPLTWGEIDMLRTDIFVPGLAGILPDRAVKPGDAWKVTDAAVAELTDLEKIDSGSIECKFEQIDTFDGKKYANLSLSGDLRGVNEDGPNRQKLTGRLYFDLKSNFISYLSINGEHELLDKDGKVNGRITGEFVMARRLNPNNPALTAAALANVALEPTADNTLLLFEEPDLGMRMLHPRRWRIGRVQKGQITLDESNGSGLLITVEFPDRVPTTPAYMKEVNNYLAGQNAKILRADKAVQLEKAPSELDRFQIDAEIAGQRVKMDYFIARQANAGATFAARILEEDREALAKEVERMARSLRMTRKFEKK